MLKTLAVAALVCSSAGFAAAQFDVVVVKAAGDLSKQSQALKARTQILEAHKQIIDAAIEKAIGTPSSSSAGSPIAARSSSTP